jgi:hypothetical protein
VKNNLVLYEDSFIVICSITSITSAVTSSKIKEDFVDKRVEDMYSVFSEELRVDGV